MSTRDDQDMALSIKQRRELEELCGRPDTEAWREAKNKPESNDYSINIILDESDPQSPLFVEIETDDGSSINIGIRETLDDGLTRLRITATDIIEAN